MKSIFHYLSLTTLLTSTALAAASSRQALIYTVDSNGDSSISTSASKPVSLETAPLIVDRRLGTNLKEKIGSTIEEDVLESLSRYGGAQRPLFADDGRQEATRLGVVIEGWDFGKSGDNLDVPSSLNVADIGKGENIWEDMVADAANARGCSFSKASKSGMKVEMQLRDQSCDQLDDGKVVDTSDEHLIEQVFYGYLPAKGRDAALVHFTFAKNSNKRISSTFSTIHNLATLAAKQAARETTILIVPSSPHTSKSKLSRRAAPVEEEPLTFLPPSTTNSTLTSPITPNLASNNNTTTLPSALAIPRCFSTLNICNSNTNNCSSHGTCTLVHRTNGGDDPSDPDCYSCICKATSNGRKGGVVNWGGNACQKKDISVQFWLFAGLGVTLVSLVVGGVGMLYGMGSEELPGVLGAGVGGPRASR